MAEAYKSCPYCGKNLQTAALRGQLVHVGICRRKRETFALAVQSSKRLRMEQSCPPSVMESGDQQQSPMEDVEVPSDEGLNDTDKALLRLFYERKDMKVSLLREIIAIARMPQTPTFRSAREMLKSVDDLPGPEFDMYTLTVPPLQQSFPLFARDVSELALGLLRRFNGRICDPRTRRKPASGSTDFVDGERYRKLQKKLSKACPKEEPVLVPLIFNAGMSLFTFVFPWLPVDY